MAPSSDRYLWLTVATAFVVRLIPLLLGAEAHDIRLYELQARPILEGQNIYQVQQRVFPYSPVSMYLPALCQQLAWWLGVPFYVTMKLPAVLGDVALSGAIYAALARTAPARALPWALFYALNPIAILVSASHGNMMSLPTLFMFLAYTTLVLGGPGKARLSALLLGLAIGFRGFPVLLLLPFLLRADSRLSQRIRYVAWASLPTFLSFVPFFLLDFQAVFDGVFAYSGGTDFGYAAMLRAIQSIRAGELLYLLEAGQREALLSGSKAVFFAAYFGALFWLRHRPLMHVVLAIWLVFYVVYVGTAAQYFVWILPFATLARDRSLIPFTATGTLAIVSFYLVYHPSVLFGQLTAPELPLVPLLIAQAILLAGFWLAQTRWLLGLLAAPAAADVGPVPSNSGILDGEARLRPAEIVILVYFAALYVWEVVFLWGPE